MGRRIISCLAFICIVAFCSAAHAGYRHELNKVTERGQLFSTNTWDAKVIWRSTFFSDNYRRAFEDKTIEIEHWNPMETAEFRAEQQFRQSQGWDFFIGMYTRKDYKEFSLGPETFWKIYITTESGVEIKPVAIERIPIAPYEQVMFPYLNRWSRAYRVTFPKVALGNVFYLTMQSIVGESTIKYKNQ